MRTRRVVLIVVSLVSLVDQAVSDDRDLLISASQSSEQALTTAHLVYRIRQNRLRPLSGLSDDVATRSPGIDKVLAARKDTDVRAELWLDSTTGKWRIEQTDQRDLDSVTRQYDVPEHQVTAVSATASMLGGTSGYVVRFTPAPRKGLHVIAIPADTKQAPPLYGGIIPSETLRAVPSLMIKDDKLDGKDIKQVTAAAEGRAAVYYADPAIGHRLRKAEYKAPDGKLFMTKTYSDYRMVDGIPYPHRYEERKWEGDGSLVEDTTVTVMDAQFNERLPKKAFEIAIPEGTAVTVLVEGAFDVFTTDKQATIDYDNALKLRGRCQLSTATKPSATAPAK